ncbi:class I SAM-dependent methyltransferase [Mariniblastus sp.]|jgi:SAM-dependent methyltransferase|nr:class I SAM-dependent methyltransferase [Mariniblastus sp.]MDB4373103.1 class I SAM-dependent methyltransferase [Mariniblastus sp.]
MKPSEEHWHNRTAWDRLAKKQDRLAKPARDVDFQNPLQSVDGPGWLGGDIRGQRVLCLAAGGGRQGPIYAAAGAIVTVVDISPAMLELDRRVAGQRQLNLQTIEASMDNLAALKNDSFEIVIHPVSTCYVQNVVPVYQEVARVLCADGIYISQHKQPTSLQASLDAEQGKYRIEHPYYDSAPLPPSPHPNLIREDGTLEYVHRWEQLLGEMCRAGLIIEDITEPMHAKPDSESNSFAHRCQFLAPYIRIKARRTGKPKTNLFL